MQDGGHRARTRSVPERLADAAARLFAERGFERTSVQELVVAAGVTKGAMYHYYSSKDDLLFAVYQRMLAMHVEALESRAQAPGPVADRLRAAADDVVRTTAAHFDESVICFRSSHMLSEERQRSVEKGREAYRSAFRAMVEEGQREGVFRADVPAHIVATQFFGAVHHMGNWYRPDGPLGGAGVGAHFADLLLAGLRPR